jgi:hypothetical protein
MSHEKRPNKAIAPEQVGRAMRGLPARPHTAD